MKTIVYSKQKERSIMVSDSGCNIDGSGEGWEQLRVHNQLLDVMMLAPKYAMLSDPLTSSTALIVMSWKRTYF